jgi:hypothetical protein
MRPFKSIAYAGPRSGTRLIVLGAVHGNETCGTHAIERVARELDSGALRLQAGRLTLVPVTNALAYAAGRRAGDRNLNRKLAPTETPRECGTTSPTGSARCSPPTRCCSTCTVHRRGCRSSSRPGDNAARSSRSHRPRASRRWRRAPRRHARRRRFGSATYAAGTLRRRELAALHPEATLDLDPRYGIQRPSTCAGSVLRGDARMRPARRSAGAQVAYRAIVNTLAHLGLSEAPTRRRAESRRCA